MDEAFRIRCSWFWSRSATAKWQLRFRVWIRRKRSSRFRRRVSATAAVWMEFWSFVPATELGVCVAISAGPTYGPPLSAFVGLRAAVAGGGQWCLRGSATATTATSILGIWSGTNKPTIRRRLSAAAATTISDAAGSAAECPVSLRV